MDFLYQAIEKNPSSFIASFVIFFLVFSVASIILGFLYDHKKNSENSKKIKILERATKDLIEEFRAMELLFSDQKKILQDYKYSLEMLNQEISRLADSLKEDSSITTAIKMANEGKSIDEISTVTGMTNEEIEPIIKYHGR